MAKKRKYVYQDSNDQKYDFVKGRYFPLPKSPVLWGVLTEFNKAKCGFCGKPIKSYTIRVFKEGEKGNPPVFYGCSAGCEPSAFHRAKFIDKKIVEWMKKRLTEQVGEFIYGYDLDAMMEEFKKLTDLKNLRKDMLTQMMIDSYHRDEILQKLVQIEKAQAKQEKMLDTYNELPFMENPLIGVILETELADLMSLDKNYLRKMIEFMVAHIRYFNEYLLLRAFPITEREYKITEGFGPQFSINLHRIPKKYQQTLEAKSKEEEEEDNN